jgi:CRISPR-associated exonuclease Cas4
MANNEVRYLVFPSEIHTYIYCPRYYFFEKHLLRRPSIKERLRMFLGTLFHLIKGFKDRIKGYSVESTISTIIGKVMIVGRPDSFKLRDNTLEIIERKSGKGPKTSAWLSDLLQASAYAFVLAREKEEIRDIQITIEYRNKNFNYSFTSDLADLVLKAVEDIILVKYYGIVPIALRGNKCKKCPFKELCDLLDEDEDVKKVRDKLMEPGTWILDIISNKEKKNNL